MNWSNPISTSRIVPAALALLVVFAVLVPKASGQANVAGKWSTLSYTMPINPVHVALLGNGKILVVAGSGNCPPSQSGCPSGPPYGPSNGSGALLLNPATGAITQFSLSWDMFCNGMVLLPDGRALINGGTIQYDPFLGQLSSAIFDPASNTFTNAQNMAHGRWYPTVLTLGDGRVMTFSGLSETGGGTNNGVEIYTLGAGWSTQHIAPWTPPLYPRMHLLPNGQVFYSGSTTSSALFDPSSNSWTQNVASTNYCCSRTYGTSILLPLTPSNNYDPRVIIMGGNSPATKTTEIIDLGASNPAWVYGPNMSQARIEMNAVILPNGKVLAVGGSVNDEDTGSLSLNADLYDPESNTFSSAGANASERLYHSVALLLPDATVWLAGGNPTRGSYNNTIEIYQPAYLFNPDGSLATRPSITAAPSSITYGNNFSVTTPDAANISSVVLVRNSAVTHAFGMDQREVALTFTAGNGTLTVTAPPNGNIAPPGYYMLFLLNSSGVPSVASFVQVNQVPPPPTNVTATAGNGQVGLSWSASTGATSYKVKRSTTSGGPYSTIASPTTTSYTDTGVTNGTTYYYVVSAVNTAGESANSSQVSATPQLAVVPPPPTNLAATAGNGQVALSWSASSGATSYNVQRSTTSGGPYTSIATPTTTSYTDTGVTNGTTYYYVVAAVNGAGQSANSSQVSATPQQTISFVQAIAGASSGSAQTLSLSFSQNTLAGDLILVAFDYDTKSTPSSVTDSQGNVFTAVGSQLTSPGGARSRVYYATSITGGTDTVKVNLSANSAWIELYLTEYSGASQTNPMDTQQGASGNAGSVSSGNGTTTVAGDRIFGYCLADDTCNAGPGFTARSTFHSNLIEDMLAGSPGSYAATGSANNGWTMQMLAIKPAVVTNPPPAPTNLVSTAGNQQVALSWSASSGATSYNVQRSTTSGGPYTSIATPTTTSYTDTSVTNGTTYYYVVAAVNSAGQSANSSQVSATPQLTVPPPPTNLVATAGNGQVGLSWSASSGATSYNVQRATTNGGPYTSIATPTTTSYTDTSVTNGTTYYYVVAALNSAGQSANSSQVSATPQGVPPVPTNLVATAGNGQVALSWSASSGATSYNVQRSTTNGGPYTTIASPTTTSYTDTGVTNGTTYYYVVAAVNSAGQSANSSQVSATPQGVPPVPTNLVATAGNGQVGLSWSASTGATSYKVKRSTTSGGPYSTIASPTTTSYTDTGVTNGTTYYYVVSAVNTAGESANSSQVSATPQLAVVPPPPTNLAATAGNGQVALSWSASSGATSYNVQRSTTSGGPYTSIATPTTTSYTDTGVTNGTTYYYVVAAVNGAGQSANSSQVSATPQQTISFVQAIAGASSGSAQTLSLSFSQNTLAGDLILVAFDYDTNSTPSSVTDSQGNVFTAVGSQLTSPGGTRSRVYYATSITGGTDTVKVNLSANSAWIELYLTEYSGASQTNPMDTQQGASGNAGSVSSGNGTTTVAGDRIFGYCVGDHRCNAGPGFTARSTFHNNLIEDMLAGSPGSYAATGSANNGWTMQMLAIKPAVVTNPPPAPTNLVSTAGNQQVALSWSASSGATSYNVQRSTTSGGPYTSIATPTTTSYTDTSVTNGTTYYYVVAAVNSAGQSANSSQVSATPQLTVPPPPTNLVATAGNGQVGLSWSASSGATSYNVQRATTNGGPYTSIATPTTTSYTDTGLTNGTTYYYAVAAVNAAGQSANSSQVSATPTASNGNLASLIGDQFADISGSSFSTLTTKNGISVPAGSAIVMAARANVGTCPTYNNAGGAATYHFTDSAGDVFSAAGCQVGSGATFSVMMGYVCNSAGGTAVTGTLNLGTAQTYPAVYMLAISNAQSASCFDTLISGSGTASTTLTSGAFSTAQAQEIAVVLGSQTATIQAFGAGSGGVFQGVDIGGTGGVETFSYTTLQSGVTVSMTQKSSNAWGMIGGAFKVANSTIAAPPTNSVVPHVASNVHVGSSTTTAVTIPSSYNSGSGIPSGHGVAVWAFNATSSTNCGGAACCLKVTDSESNTYTTNTTSYDSSFIGTEFLATGKVTTSLKGDGTETVTCSFYQNNCSTVIGKTTLYCRVFDVPQFASVDNASTPVTGGFSAGAVTVASGTDDIIWAIWDEAGTSSIQDQCLGYNLNLAQADGGGGTQLAESTLSPNGVTPCGASGSPGGTWGAALSIVP